MLLLNRYLILLSVFVLLFGGRVATISSFRKNFSVFTNSLSVTNDTFNYDNYARRIKIYVNLDKEQGKIYLSSIFEWYGDDWKANYAPKEGFAGRETERAILNFLNQYLPIQNQFYLRQDNYKIDYLNYDWSLNKQ